MIQPVNDISIVGPSGELDLREGEALLETIGSLLRHEWVKIVLDLGEVEHIHFHFLNRLLALAHAFQPEQGAIKIANLNAYTRELLRLTGVDRFFDTYDSVADAILSFEGPSEDRCGLQ